MEKRNVQTIALLLVAVALVSFVLGKRSGAKRQAWRSAVAAHHEAGDYCRALAKEARLRVNLAFNARMSLAEFQEHFGRVEPIDRRAFPDGRDDTTHVYTHEPSHGVFYLRFENDVLMGGTFGYNISDFGPHLPTIEDRMAKLL